jgi:hypothetical protein
MCPGSEIDLPSRRGGTAHSALCLVQQVFQWEWDDLGVEQQRLKEWNSLLKSRTKSKKDKVKQRREQLDTMQDLLKEEQVTIGVFKQ